MNVQSNKTDSICLIPFSFLTCKGFRISKLSLFLHVQVHPKNKLIRQCIRNKPPKLKNVCNDVSKILLCCLRITR